MMKEYKIWAYIEENDDENYSDISNPIPIGTFKTKDEAFECVDELFINREEL